MTSQEELDKALRELCRKYHCELFKITDPDAFEMARDLALAVRDAAAETAKDGWAQCNRSNCHSHDAAAIRNQDLPALISALARKKEGEYERKTNDD